MSITLLSSPSSNVSSNNPIEWKLQFTAIGTPPVVKRALYYLADSSGTRVSEIYVWVPLSTSEVLVIDVKKIVKGSVTTSLPSCNTGMVTDSTAYKQYKLYYAESSFNTTTCMDSVAAYSQSSLVTVYNLKLDVDTALDFVWSGGKTGTFMNSYPTRMKWSTDGEQYAWFAGVGSIRITWYSSTGATLTTITHTLTGATAKYVSLDWRCHSIAKPHSMLLEVNEGTGYVSYNISYDACTCRGFYTGLTFLDPKGGRSHVPINCPHSVSLERTSNEFLQYGETITTNGRSTINPLVKEKLKLTIPLGATPGDLKFAKALIGSPGFQVLKMSEAGVKTWYKFLLDSGEIGVIKGREDVQVELNGSFADDKGGQTNDI